MKRNLFFTTTLISAAFICNNALAENITKRIKVSENETKIFNNAIAKNISSGNNDGGVIYNAGTIKIGESSSFTDNSVSDGGMGGVIYNEKGKITVSNSLFEKNSATGIAVSSGGSIYNSGKLDKKGNPAAIMEISDSALNYNKSSFGGAIYNSGQLDLTDVLFIKNNATFKDRNFGGAGGALYNYWLTTINGGLFKFNRAFDGGAVFNRDTTTISSTFTKNSAYAGGAVYNERKMTIFDSAFIGNTAEEEDESDLPSGVGGAVYNSGKMTVTNTTFEENSTDAYFSYGGAVYNNKYGEMVISDSVFLKNEAKNGNGYGSGHGGAISNVGGGTITISDTTFTQNKTHGANGSPDLGGAVYNNAGTIKITNVTFADNETIGSASGLGGAIYNEGLLNKSGIIEISDSSFIGNRSSFGGAINNDDILTLTDVTFNQNQAHMDYAVGHYGGAGGAVYNNYFGQTSIINGSFKNNSSMNIGGAIYNRGIISFSGNTIFENNRDGKKLNDIYNEKIINIDGDLALDGGISGYRGRSNYGTVVFADGSDLSAKAGITTISQNNVENEGATLHINIRNGFSGDYALITDYSTLDNEFKLADNNLYNIAYTDTKGTYTISKKSSSEVADKIGVSSNEAAAILAITDGNGKNPTFNQIADNIGNLIQSNNSKNIKNAIEAAEAMSPDASPMVQQTQTETLNQILNAVETRFNDGAPNGSKGISSGDVLKDIAVWMQGLVNHAKLNSTSKSNGFKSDTYGVAFGVEKKLNNDIKAGIGYAYDTIDVDAPKRDTDVKTHTLFAYGKYKPSNWFVNGVISYGWSDYKEKKNVFENIVRAKYDVKTFGMQTMTGYDLYTQYATFTPEAGLRYIHINGDNYTDSAGQNIKLSNSNIITGIVGSKISKTFEPASDLRITPEIGVALAYDLKKAHNKSSVMLSNGSSYVINGKTLNRFGVELSGKLTAEVNDNIELSLGYEGGFRKDYQNHSGLFNIKYKF